jgi:hypothetical protein
VDHLGHRRDRAAAAQYLCDGPESLTFACARPPKSMPDEPGLNY